MSQKYGKENRLMLLRYWHFVWVDSCIFCQSSFLLVPNSHSLNFYPLRVLSAEHFHCFCIALHCQFAVFFLPVSVPT